MQLYRKLASVLLVAAVSGGVVSAASVPLVVQVSASAAEVNGRTIKLSPYYQVVLEFPQAIDLVGGSNTGLFKATVPDAPQDRYLLLDALATTGTATINVITGGRVLPLMLVIDGKAKTGTRKYVFTDVEAAAPETAPSPTAAAPATSKPAALLTATPGVPLTVTPQAASDAALNAARDDLVTALTRIQDLKGQGAGAVAAAVSPMRLQLTAAVTTGEGTDALTLSVQNTGTGAVTLNADDLQLWVDGQRVQVQAEDLEVDAGETQRLNLDLGLKLRAGDAVRVTWLAGDGRALSRLETTTQAK